MIDVLAAYPRLTRQLSLYVDQERLDEGSTIKLDWSRMELNAAVHIMEQWLATSDRMCIEAREKTGDYSALVQMQGELHGALREIHEYCAA